MRLHKLLYRNLKEEFANKFDTGIGDDSVTDVRSELEKDMDGEELEGCDQIADVMSGKNLEHITRSILTDLTNQFNGNNNDTCFIEKLKKKKIEIDKYVNILESKNKNYKKEAYSNLVGLDIRVDYLNSLQEKITKAQKKIAENQNENSKNSLTYDEKNNINKRLTMYYDKNLSILNIIYNIFYYLYLSLFIIYFILCIWNFYMYKFKEENDYFSKFKFTLIGTLLITIVPMILGSILNKYIYF